MANQSIYDAFERMWQHTVALVGQAGSGGSPLIKTADGGLCWVDYNSGDAQEGGVAFNSNEVGEWAFAVNDGMANGKFSFAAGEGTVATGYYSAVFGRNNDAARNGAFVAGEGNTGSNLQAVFGHYSSVDQDNAAYKPSLASSNAYYNHPLLKVGNGSSSSYKRNAFVVRANGLVTAQASFVSDEGADYAEMLEWADANSDGEDRRGLFVTINEEGMITVANEGDYVDGVISAKPSILGDSADLEWNKKYLTDIFGVRLTEEVEIEPEQALEDGTVIPAQYETRPVLNPEYDENLTYLPRVQRGEWAKVGLLGKLIVVDDGTCVPGGFCTNADGGIATKSEGRIGWRVLARLDENHIKILYK